MRILQVHNFYQIPGGECAVVAAEKELLGGAGHEVVQFTKNSKEIDNLTRFGKLALLPDIVNNKKAYDEINALVRDRRPDVAHVHNVFPLLSPAIYPALHQARIPVVQTHHNFRVLCPNALFFRTGKICEACGPDFTAAHKNGCVKGSRIISFLYARAIRKGWQTGAFTRAITLHIALNRFFARKLAAGGIPAADIKICGNFVTDFAGQVAAKEPYFLFLGRLSPEKGLFTLLEATRKTKRRVKIAGSGPLENQVRQFIAAHGLDHVEFVGFVAGDRKTALLEKCIAAIIPSLCYENFSIAAVEALAHGAPVIASRIGGLPETVAEGRTGHLFQPGKASELATLLDQLANNPEVSRQLAGQALDHAREKLGPQTHVKRLEKIYHEAIGKFQ